MSVAPDRDWIPVRPPAWNRNEEAPPVLEVLYEGYAISRVPFEEMRGRVEVALVRAVPDVTGEILVPRTGSEPPPIDWALRPVGSAPAVQTEFRGAIRGPGPFRLFDVPDGRWTLEVSAWTPEGVRWARRDFEKAGVPVDLGAVEVSGWSGFRARAVDPDGRPLRLPVHLVFTFSPGTSLVLVRSFGKSTVVLRSGPVVVIDGSVPQGGADIQDRTPDAEGWVSIRGLLPGAHYALACTIPGAPAVEADAPAATGEMKEIEIRVTVRPARCVVRFTAWGGTPAAWGEILDGLPGAGGQGDGLFEGPLYPGTYHVACRVRMKEGDPERVVQADFQVPEREAWEGTVDLK